LLHRNLKLKIMKNTDEALGKLIEKGIEVAEQTGKFVIDQAPELIQQFYTWHIAQNIFGVLLGLFLFFVAYKVIILLGEDESNWDTDFKLFGKHVGMGTGIISSCICLFASIFLFCSIYQLIYILVAPKLYLIEYFIK